MARASITLGAVALALGAAIIATIPGRVSAGAPQQKPDNRWAESWEAALAEAKERNVPIFVTFHQDG